MKRYIVTAIVFALCALLLPTVGLLGLALYYQPQLPDTQTLKKVELQTPLKIYTLDGKLITEYGEKLRTPIAYEDIPQTYINALLAIEDKNFFEHNGIEPKALARAMIQLVRNCARGSCDISSGGSTITMQAARNFFLNNRQQFERKFKEILLSLDMEKTLSKQEIMELYVNKIFLGNRTYGIQSAAQIYYGKKMNELNLAQQAMIAGIQQAPSKNNPIRNPDAAKNRRNDVLAKMLKRAVITQEAYDQAILEPITARLHRAASEINAQYVGEMARDFIVKKYGDELAQTAGLKVYTTILSNHQQAAEQAVTAGLELYDRRHGYRGPHSQLETETVTQLQTLVADRQNTQTDQAIQEAKSQLITWLKPYFNINGLIPAVVANIEEEKTLLFSIEREWTELSLQGVKWAREFIDVNRRGPPIKAMSEVLTVGDIVYFRQAVDDNGKSYWKLGQIPQAQAAFVSLSPNNGAIKSLVGGYNFTLSPFNNVTQALRQGGSTLKPFLYSAGLENGFNAASIFNDAPLPFTGTDDWRPSNSGNEFNGPMRLREALYRSRNLVSIRLMQRLSLNFVIPYYKRFGFDSEDEKKFPRDLSLSLGSAVIKPLDAAIGFAAFANGGYKVNPFFIHHIRNRNDEIIYQSSPTAVCRSCWEEEQKTKWPTQIIVEENQENLLKPKVNTTTLTWQASSAERAITPENAYIIDSILKDVIQRGTGRVARKLNRQDIAGKTGTTNDQFDAWFTGYAPKELVASVWVGFSQQKTLGEKEFGGRVALPIWMDYMNIALEGVPENYLVEPSNIITASIAPKTGKIVPSGTEGSEFEIFMPSSMPEKAPIEETIFNPFSISTENSGATDSTTVTEDASLF